MDLVTRLKNGSSVTLSATKDIVKSHQIFTRCVADNFEQSIASGTVVYDTDIERLANDINKLSINVSTSVETMRKTLKELVETLETAQRKNGKSLLKTKTWVWLRKAIQVFCALLGAASTINTLAFQSDDCGMAFSLGAAFLKGTAFLLEKTDLMRKHHNPLIHPLSSPDMDTDEPCALCSRAQRTGLRRYPSELEGEDTGRGERRTTKSLKVPRMSSNSAAPSTDQRR